jgi:hypothetical protein
MAQRGAPAGWDSPADRPSVLEITVESGPRRRPPVRGPHVLIALAVLVAIGAVVCVALLPGGGTGSAPTASTSAPPTAPPQPSVLVDSGPPSVATPQLYRFPVGCSDSRVTTVERNRPGLCTPHNGEVTVVLRRVGHVWRATLESTDSSCTPLPVPPLARGKVKACRR